MSRRERERSYDFTALMALAYEFPSTDRAVTERNIRHDLAEKQLGDYDADRIALLRRLKDSVQVELSRGSDSKYYVAQPRSTANQDDFDYERMTADYQLSYPTVARDDIYHFIGFGIYLYYLR